MRVNLAATEKLILEIKGGDSFFVCCGSSSGGETEFWMPSKDRNHDGGRTDSFSCVRQSSIKGCL